MVVGEEETKILTSSLILTVGTTSVAVSFAGETIYVIRRGSNRQQMKRL